jgi:carbon storage regulator CsrA
MSRLVIERKVGSSFSIGDDVEVTVERVRGRRAVRLAIEAPRNVSIVRDDTLNVPAKRAIPRCHRALRVLVVEDNTSHAELIGQAFADSGVDDLSILRTGREAIVYLDNAVRLDRGRPQLVLLDLNLPDMTGMEVLRRLRGMDAYRTLPITILSSYADDEHVADCLHAGATAYITKDCRYGELRESVARIAEFWSAAIVVARRDRPAAPSTGYRRRQATNAAQ